MIGQAAEWAETEETLRALAQAAGLWPALGVQRAIAFAVRRQNTERVEFLQNRFMKLIQLDDSRLHPFLPDPDPELLQGEIHLGTLVSGGQVCLPLQALLLNVFISGPPRQGKSVLITQIVEQLLELGVPVHIFDTQGEYQDVLAPLFPPAYLECLDVRDCKINPFTGPSSMSQKAWVLGPMCDYLREALWWRDRTIELFRTICLDLIEKGVDPITPPIFVEAFEKVPNYKKNSPEVGSLQRFATMVRTLETFQCVRGERVEDLAGKSRIYDLWNVSKDVRQFFVSHMITLHKASRSYKRDRNLEMVFVFDELSQFITKDALTAKADLGESFFLELLRTGRKLGIGCILADQTYSLIHQVVRTNCQSKIVFQTSDGPSRYQITHDVGLTREQGDFLAELSFKQDQRRSVALLPNYPRAFLLAVDDFAKPQPLPQEEVDNRLEFILKNMQWEPIPIREEPEPKSTLEGILPDKMLSILKTIVFDYFATQQDHARQMRISESTFSKYAQRLKEAELLREEVINKGTRGGLVKILIPMEKGYEYLDAANIAYKPMPGNGSIAHRFWQHLILKKMKQKSDIGGIEFSLDSKRVDVGIINHNKKIAYEVVMEGSLQKEISNLRKDLLEGWSVVIFCVQSEEVRQALAALIDRELNDSDDRVEIRLLKEFS